MRVKTRKALNKAGIPQNQHFMYDDYGKLKRGGRVHITEWSEPEDYRVWIPTEKRLPSRSGKFVIRWSDGYAGVVEFNKKSQCWNTGLRVTHWSKDDRAYPAGESAE